MGEDGIEPKGSDGEFSPMSKRFHIVTTGCQMNVLDSELAAALLISRGYERTADQKKADVILFNTCSVREHAEEKIYSALGRLKHWKSHHPNGVLGVFGCMAQKDQWIIFRRAPHVDVVVGPGQLDRLPDLVEAASMGEGPQMAVSINRFAKREKALAVRESFHQYDPIRLPETRPALFQAMVRIMFGCDRFCSYCIVPSVRGPEQSRPASDILEEVRTLADQGCVEVTLLGQSVNLYQFNEGGKMVHLADLLERINEVPGIRRVRFVSNYPTGMTDALLQAVRDLPTAVPYLHVPAQHGADSVLKRMNRHYTAAEYRDLTARIYEAIPGAAITSDFIVGFCGETEDEFQETVRLVRETKFKNSFIFKYSERSGTRSAELFEDDVPDEVKRRRNNELLAVQNEVCTEAHRSLIGSSVEILVDGRGTKPGQLSGRTPCDRIVVFDGPDGLIGSFQMMEIVGSTPFTLFGKIKQKDGERKG